MLFLEYITLSALVLAIILFVFVVVTEFKLLFRSIYAEQSVAISEQSESDTGGDSDQGPADSVGEPGNVGLQCDSDDSGRGLSKRSMDLLRELKLSSEAEPAFA